MDIPNIELDTAQAAAPVLDNVGGDLNDLASSDHKIEDSLVPLFGMRRRRNSARMIGLRRLNRIILSFRVAKLPDIAITKYAAFVALAMPRIALPRSIGQIGAP